MRRRDSEDADTLRSLFQLALEIDKAELSPKSLIVLAFLALQPSGEADYAEVRDTCGLSGPQTTRTSDSLIEANLVTRHVLGEDRRKTRLKLSTKGRNVIERIIQATHLG